MWQKGDRSLKVYHQSIAGDYKEYSITDDDGGTLEVQYSGDPPKMNDIVRVSGNLGCHMKENAYNITGPSTTIIDYMVLKEESRSVR